MINKLNKFFNNKKGMSTINVVISIFIFIIVLSFFTDLLIFGGQLFVTSSVASDVARIAGVQGGVLSSTPTGYPGGSSAYQNSYELTSTVKEAMNGIGIDDSNYRVRINGYILTNGQNVKIDYLRPIQITVDYTYEWTLFENFLNVPDANLTLKRNTKSEFKYNYGHWIGE